MKFDAVIVRDNEGERRLDTARLPLRVGTGGDCDIRLPGPGSHAVAMLDELDGEPFIQPVGGSTALLVNGETLRASRKLSVGDELEFYGTRVKVGGSEGTMVFDVLLEGSAYVTRPPDTDNAVAGPAEETIVATAFRRAAETPVSEPKAGILRWQSMVGAGVGLLLLLSFFLFSSKSIQFDVQPAGADDISISGGWFKLPLGDRILMREGTYTVQVQKEGYYDVSQTLLVGDEPSKTVVVEMRRLPGQLSVFTDPEVAAVVTVDDSRVGTAPFGPLELEPGTHLVTVKADRYLPFEQRLQIRGLGLYEELQVQLVPMWANVEISSSPSGAAVFRGREKIGETPLTMELVEGSHSLSVIKDGFKAWDGSVETVANVSQVLPTVELEAANAQLRVSSIPLGANVTINGRYRGQSPVTIALSPDIDYEVELSKAGYGNTSRNVRLGAAAAEEITIDMTARVGAVTVKVLPEDATVYVDGRPRGSGTMTLNLSSAPHQLEVKKEGYASFARSVTPRPGYPQTIQVRLLSDAEIEARSTARTMVTSQGQELVRVEPGALTLGTSRREQSRRANEVLVPVLITKPFFISAREVSNREYRKFRPNHDSGAGLHASLAGDLNPVVSVSWDGAVEYLNAMSVEEGLTPAYEKVFERWQPVAPTPNGYRLPTEAEWEWAIRYQGKPKASVFPWGDRMPPRNDSGNYAGKSSAGLVPSILPGYDDGYASTAPVGSFQPNSLGIYDSGGNVSEWIQDYYSVPTPGQTEPLSDPQGPTRGTNRVIRGSSWMHAGTLELRYGYRDFGNNGRPDVGFRVARNVE